MHCGTGGESGESGEEESEKGIRWESGSSETREAEGKVSGKRTQCDRREGKNVFAGPIATPPRRGRCGTGMRRPRRLALPGISARTICMAQYLDEVRAQCTFLELSSSRDGALMSVSRAQPQDELARCRNLGQPHLRYGDIHEPLHSPLGSSPLPQKEHRWKKRQ